MKNIVGLFVVIWFALCGAGAALAADDFASHTAEIQRCDTTGKRPCIAPGGTGPALCTKDGCLKCGIYAFCPDVAGGIQTQWAHDCLGEYGAALLDIRGNLLPGCETLPRKTAAWK